jgi:hypothetical protein
MGAAFDRRYRQLMNTLCAVRLDTQRVPSLE